MKKNKTLKKIIAVLLALNVIALVVIGFLYSENKAGGTHGGKGSGESYTFNESVDKAAELVAGSDENALNAAAAYHVYSHRGNGEGVEEHSFAGYDKAIKDGSAYIEQDIVTSADGTLYVSHDASAYDLTGTNRNFAGMTDEEIDRLTTHAGNHTLRLSEVFDRYGDSVHYVIELKSTDSGAAERFASLVREYGNEDRIIVQCFSADVLRQLEESFPDMPKLFLCRTASDARARTDEPYIDIISVRKNAASEELCDAVHESGKKFSVWTLDTGDEIRNAIEMGADSYFTNDTPLALSMERQYRHRSRVIPRKTAGDGNAAGSMDSGGNSGSVGKGAEPEVLFFTSDYQKETGFPEPSETLAGVLAAGAADGLVPDRVVVCGDYTNDRKLHNYQVSPEDSISEIKSVVSSGVPELGEDGILFEQGNHDKLTDSIAESGLHEFDNYYIYVLNTENDFPWKQGKVSGSHDKVEAAAKALKESLDELIEKGETKPVFIAGHVPLHFTARTSSKHSTGDNLYSSLVFDVLNEAGRSLDIVFIFGHNHSKGWDCYLGGSSVFKPAGDTILIPEYTMSKATTETFREETLNFTYMNAGYCGYYMNCSYKEAEAGKLDRYAAADDTLTGTFFEIYPDRIIIHRYSAEGEHALGWDGEADPYMDHVDKGLIDEKYYEEKTDGPQEIDLTD